MLICTRLEEKEQPRRNEVWVVIDLWGGSVCNMDTCMGCSRHASNLGGEKRHN
jgi:mannose/fructose-specific phosphotransferase system component IIA